jgi:IMP and pyridine-specific 5'-nucleotidase
LEIFKRIELLIEEDILLEKSGLRGDSKLKALVPSIGKFFTALPLCQAFPYVNNQRSITGREHVPPSFNDIRLILNRAQILAVAPKLKLITFDGDMTLYADGADFAKDSALVGLIKNLLMNDIMVAIVTAAGYPKDPSKYEQRLSGLLAGFRSQTNCEEKFSNFYVMGGECNFLFRYDHKGGHLICIPEEEYQPDFVKKWSGNEDELQKFLDVAFDHLQRKLDKMGLKERATLIRKNRAIGVLGKSLVREQVSLCLPSWMSLHCPLNQN